MTTKERLKLFIKTQNMTVSEFEKAIKVSNGYVNSITKSIPPDKLSIIVDNFPLINIYWLLLGKGEMLLSGGGAAPYPEAPETGAAGEANSLPVVADERQGHFASTPTEQVLRQLVSALERTIKDKEEIISLIKKQQPK